MSNGKITDLISITQILLYLRGQIGILGAVFLMEEKSLPKKHTSTYTTCKGSALELFSKIKAPPSAMDNSVG